MTKIIVVDEDRCLGCKQCMIECAMEHSDAETLAEAIRNGELQSRVHVESVGEFGVPIQCRHCEDAPCMEVCPTNAITREGPADPVLLDQDKCIGCKFCLMACPFGVITLARSGKAVVKCDMCIERAKNGEPPACVVGCPTKAMQLVELDEALSEKRRKAAAILRSVGAIDKDTDE
ncbi:MAG: 4Fe-4S binding protein [Phycisphaerae bacterium]|nr:4Fe-4S binding protein [Phycisphaerae bacterium]